MKNKIIIILCAITVSVITGSILARVETLLPLEQWIMGGASTNRIIRPVSSSTIVVVGANASTTTSKLQTPSFTITGLLSCDTLDTNASGTLICGTDATGGAGSFTTTTINGMSSTTYTFVAGTGLTFATSGPSNLTFTNNGVLSINGATGTISGLNLYNTTTTITGTTNQVIVSQPTGAVILSLPQNIHTTATPTFASTTLSNFSNGSIIFATSSGSLSMNNNLFWDNTNNRLGIGTTTPNNLIQVYDLIDFKNADFNTKIGYQAGKNIVSGANTNTFIGYQAGVGAAVGGTVNASYNVAIGYHALFSNTTGENNLALGTTALGSNTTGSNNTGIGLDALFSNTTGTDNTANGYDALYLNTTGINNTAFGSNALILHDTGDNNTAFGMGALARNVSGSNNVGVGYYAGSWETGSNTFYVDNQDRVDAAGDKTNALIYGTFNASSTKQTLTFNSVVSIGTSTNGIFTVATGTVKALAIDSMGPSTFNGLVQFNKKDFLSNNKSFRLVNTSGFSFPAFYINASDDVHFFPDITSGVNNVYFGFNSPLPLQFGGKCCGGNNPTSISFNALTHDFKIDDTTVMKITSGGLVGIGTTTPQAKLDINGGAFIRGIATTTNLVITSLATTTPYYLSINSNGTIITTSTAISATPGGLDTQIQYNNGLSFAGDSNFTWASSTKLLTVGSTTINGLLNQSETRAEAGTYVNFSNSATNNTTPGYTGMQFSWSGNDGNIDPMGETGVSFITSSTLNNTVGSAGAVSMRGVNYDSTFTKNGAVAPTMDVVRFSGHFNNNSVSGDTINLATFDFENIAGTASVVNGFNFNAPTITGGSITQFTPINIANMSGSPVIVSLGTTDTYRLAGKMVIGTTGGPNTIGANLNISTVGISPVSGIAGTVMPISVFLTNRSGGTSVANDLYIFDTGNANSVSSSTVASSTLVACVVQSASANAALMRCAFSGQVSINATGTVAIGDRLCTSVTAGKAASCNLNPTFGAVIGRATAAHSGTVSAIKAIIGIQ